MKVILDASSVDIRNTEIASGAGHVGVKRRERGLVKKRISIPRRKDDVDMND
jgi:hypothetical protein